MKKRIVELESLRGIMCFIIAFFYHYNWLMTNNFPIRAMSILYEKGYYVVETFFVLSGFGMALGYSEKLRSDNYNINIFAYLWMKMKKLFPIMTVTLLVTTISQIIYILRNNSPFQVGEVTVYSFVFSLLNISAGWFCVDTTLNMPLWYLSGLMMDYIAYYVICRISKLNRNRYLFLIFVFAIYGLSIVISGNNSDKPFMYYNIARGHACFFVGTVLKEIYEYVNVKKAREILGNLCFIVLLSIAVLVFVITKDETRVLASSQWLSQMVYGNVLSPMILWTCMFCKPISWLMRRKLLVDWGREATSIYIWHFPCYFFLRLILPQQYIEEYGYRLWWYVCVILFISIVGCFSNKYLEPWLNKKTEEVVKAIHYSPADK